MERITAILLIEYDGPDKVLHVDLKSNGVPETAIMTALEWASREWAQNIVNKAIVVCGTTDPETINQYLKTQREVEDTDINKLL